MGPAPPSLEPILTSGVTPEALDALIDDVLRLDSATCPLLWRDGALRPMVEAAFASMVMYFDERKDAGEMHLVLEAMCNALKDPRVKLDEGAAPTVFSRWGVALKLQFELDNLHLTSGSADTGVVQVVTVVQSLGRTVRSAGCTLPSGRCRGRWRSSAQLAAHSSHPPILRAALPLAPLLRVLKDSGARGVLGPMTRGG